MESKHQGFDPRQVQVIVCLKNQDRLDRAKELLELTINYRNKRVARTLAGSTIIVAMAYMVQEVENRLTGEIACRIQSQGGKPTLAHVRDEIPPKLLPKAGTIAENA